mgnify:CR=1 FL=1
MGVHSLHRQRVDSSHRTTGPGIQQTKTGSRSNGVCLLSTYSIPLPSSAFITIALPYIWARSIYRSFRPSISYHIDSWGHVYPRFSAQYQLLYPVCYHSAPLRSHLLGYLICWLAPPDWIDIHMILIVNRLINLPSWGNLQLEFPLLV